MNYEDLIKGLELNNQSSIVPDIPVKEIPTHISEPVLFTVEDFKQNLKENSANSNKRFIATSERLNAYDIVHSCIRNPIFRLLGTPIHDYSDNWLPVKLRAAFGSACHDFLQTNSACFTETEVYLRIPSINMSVKIDCLTGTNILVEIKTCSYADYDKILKSGHARTEDFYQALLYRYLLVIHKIKFEMLNTVWEDVKRQYYSGDTITRLLLINIAFFLFFRFLWLGLFITGQNADNIHNLLNWFSISAK